MKIENVETWLAWKWVAVRVTCDDGTYGVGEAQFWSYAEASEAIIKRIGEDLLGRDPKHIDDIWNAAYRQYSFRSAAITAALSAIDMALWDIKGKRLGAPVWDLLGGKVRDKVRAMVLIGGDGPARTPDDFAASARRAKDRRLYGREDDPVSERLAGIALPAVDQDQHRYCGGRTRRTWLGHRHRG